MLSPKHTKLGNAVYPDIYPQRPLFAQSRFCRDGMGPRNKTNSITTQSRPARQSPRNNFWGFVSCFSIQAHPVARYNTARTKLLLLKGNFRSCATRNQRTTLLELRQRIFFRETPESSTEIIHQVKRRGMRFV